MRSQRIVQFKVSVVTAPLVTTPLWHRLTRQLVSLTALAAVFLLAACASETLRRDGLAMVGDGRYEEGLAKIEESVKADPNNVAARRDYLRQREQVLTRILAVAGSELALEHYDAAETQYRRVLRIEPNNRSASKGLVDLDASKRHGKWLADAQAAVKNGDSAAARSSIEAILVEDPNNVKANQLRFVLAESALKENLSGPTLNIKGRKPVTLQFREANLKMVLEAIARTTALNILVDKDVRNDVKVTIFVKDTPVEETLDLILLQNQLEKRVLGENTVLIYPLNQAKTKDYQELKIRRFALTNADPKQVQSMLKTILKAKDVYVDEKTNAVVVRDTLQVVRLAENLVASMDQAEAEVMIELELLDMNRNRSLQLGVNWPNSVSWMLPNSMTLAQYKNRTSADVTVTATPFGVALSALESDGDTRVLANPRIRARSKEKAKIMIGSRTPIISSAAVPNTTVQASVYNTTLQDLDTGIKLEVEPTVHLDGEVAIKLNMEVSDLGDKYENIQTGTLAYSTTTNNASTILRLHDGETQVLAGLVRAFTSSGAAQKVPLLGDIPVLGRLFGINADDWQNREIVLAVTPHIIRNNQAAEADLLELWSGTETSIRYGESSLKAAGTGTVLSQSGTGSSAPRTGPQQSAQLSPQQRLAAAASQSLSAVLTGPARAKVGDKITVAVNLQGGAALTAIHAVLQYDNETLKALTVTEGDLIRRNGVKSNFAGQIDENGGTLIADLASEAGSVTSNGGGVATIQFEVLRSQSPALVSVSSIEASGDNSAAVTVTVPQPLSINIQASP